MCDNKPEKQLKTEKLKELLRLPANKCTAKHFLSYFLLLLPMKDEGVTSFL